MCFVALSRALWVYELQDCVLARGYGDEVASALE